MIHKPGLALYTPDREELFRRVIGTTDFSKCKSGLDIAGAMFNALFPIIKQIVDDNEIILIDQAKQQKMFAELDEKHKKLVNEHDELQEKYNSLRIELQKEGS